MQNLLTSSIVDPFSQVLPEQMSFIDRMTPQYLGVQFPYDADLVVLSQGSMIKGDDRSFVDYPFIGML